MSVPVPEILYIDNHVIAILKPPGIPAQEDESGDLCIGDYVKAYLKEKYNKPGDVYLGVLHRLDRPVGGIMILARTSKAAERLSTQFQNRSIEKKYMALVENIPRVSEKTLVHFIYKLQGKNIMKASSHELPGSKKCTLRYKVIETGEHSALLEVEPLTGRQHQIRVQLSEINCPIRGDIKYGSREPNPDKSICLFAQSITFEHPTTHEKITIKSPKPDSSWWKLD